MATYSIVSKDVDGVVQPAEISSLFGAVSEVIGKHFLEESNRVFNKLLYLIIASDFTTFLEVEFLKSILEEIMRY